MVTVNKLRKDLEAVKRAIQPAAEPEWRENGRRLMQLLKEMEETRKRLKITPHQEYEMIKESRGLYEDAILQEAAEIMKRCKATGRVTEHGNRVTVDCSDKEHNILDTATKLLEYRRRRPMH